MNIQAAYLGAIEGLAPRIYDKHVRDLQFAIPLQLALMRPRGDVVDGQQVTNQDLKMLKYRGKEVRLK